MDQHRRAGEGRASPFQPEPSKNRLNIDQGHTKLRFSQYYVLGDIKLWPILCFGRKYFWCLFVLCNFMLWAKLSFVQF